MQKKQMDKPAGILRYAQTLEQVLAQYYLVPKDQAQVLLTEAVTEVIARYPDKELETIEEVVEFVEDVLDCVSKKLER